MFNKTQLSMLLVLAVWSLTGCSSETDSPSAAAVAVAASRLPTVLIERESRFEDPQAYVHMRRKIIESCQMIRAATGLGASTEEISDAEILALEKEVILEVFDRDRYAKIRTTASIDRERLGFDPGQSCIPQSKIRRHIFIHLPCSLINVGYDPELPEGGTRSQWDNGCIKHPFPDRESNIARIMKGERMAIEGTDLHCRWMEPLGGDMGRACLLEPWFEYRLPSGDDMKLLVKFQSKKTFESFDAYQAAPLLGLDAMAHAMTSGDYPLRVEVGKPLPPGIFEVPADARGFPLTVEGAK